jgi:hypothetical protein
MNYDYFITNGDGKKRNPSYNVSKNSVLPLVPDQCTYNLVCRVYASCDGGKDAAIRAESILLRMIQRHVLHNSSLCGWAPPSPNTITFNTVLNVWAKSENCGNESEQSFRNLERYSHLQSSKNSRNVVKPNARSLSAVIEAWSRSNKDYGSDRAVAILETVIEKWIHRSTNHGLHGENFPHVIRPNNYLIHQTLNVLAKSGKGYLAAQNLQHAI